MNVANTRKSKDKVVQKKVTVVVPVYYNEGSLPILHQRLSEVAARESEFGFEFIFVDDGSGDNSYRVLQEISRQDARVKVVKLVRNFGSTNAQLAGIGYATGDAVVVISADLQDPPELIHDMLPHWKKGTRMVFAARNQRDDPFTTRLPADLFNFMFRNFALKKYPKGGFDCFLIDRQVVNVVIQCAEKNTHLPGLLVWAGFEYEIIYYHRQERKHGKSRWNLSRKLKYFADAFTAFSYLPLRLCSALGFFLAFVGLVYVVVLVFFRLFGKIQVEGWTTLMIVVLITTGLQLLMLGIVGEYLWRNFDQSRHRPLYLVDQVTQQPVTPVADGVIQTSTENSSATPSNIASPFIGESLLRNAPVIGTNKE